METAAAENKHSLYIYNVMVGGGNAGGGSGPSFAFLPSPFKKNLRLKTQRSGNQLFVTTQIGPTAHGAGLVPLTHLLLKVVEGQTKHCF